ncbi:hypothetical protein BDF19DRAFT_417061 [Syncephalis fuscata]|nr:hypothetical protein BDF19DRAFT_417061 [Syncephalis fuscata]
MRFSFALIGMLLPFAAAARYTINEPNGLTVWEINKEVTISWSYQADDKTAADGTLKLELYRAGEGIFGRDSAVATISDEIAASQGTKKWTVPDVDTKGTFYVRLDRLNSGLLPDRTSSAKFKIQSANAPSPTVPTPTESIVIVTPTVYVNGTLTPQCQGVKKECERQMRVFINCSCGELLADPNSAGKDISAMSPLSVLLAGWSLAVLVIVERYLIRLA